MSSKTESLKAFKGNKAGSKRATTVKAAAPAAAKRRVGRPADPDKPSYNPKSLRFTTALQDRLTEIGSARYANRPFTNLVETLVLRALPDMEKEHGVVWNEKTNSYEPL